MVLAAFTNLSALLGNESIPPVDRERAWFLFVVVAILLVILILGIGVITLLRVARRVVDRRPGPLREAGADPWSEAGRRLRGGSADDTGAESGPTPPDEQST